MSYEAINALAAVGTFVVIGATAIAAVVQLRHLRASNQLTAFLTIERDFERPEFQGALAYVGNELLEKMGDPAYRDEILGAGALDRMRHPEARIAAFFEQLGLFAKRGVVDKAMFLDAYSSIVVRQWESLGPFIALTRERAGLHGGLAVWENFEYLAVLSYDWAKRFPNGTLPKNFPRLPVAAPATIEPAPAVRKEPVGSKEREG